MDTDPLDELTALEKTVHSHQEPLLTLQKTQKDLQPFELDGSDEMKFLSVKKQNGSRTFSIEDILLYKLLSSHNSHVC